MITILLVNKNRLISTLFNKYIVDNLIELEEKESLFYATKSSYDIVFIDEDVLNNSFIDSIYAKRKILFSFSNTILKGFDKTLKKPFLPLDIINILENREKKEIKVEVKESKEEESFTLVETSILNKNEIDNIKELLNMNVEENVTKKDNNE